MIWFKSVLLEYCLIGYANPGTFLKSFVPVKFNSMPSSRRPRLIQENDWGGSGL